MRSHLAGYAPTAGLSHRSSILRRNPEIGRRSTSR